MDQTHLILSSSTLLPTFLSPPETTQHFSSTLSQGLHVPGKEFKSEDESFRMNCLKH